jgi:predicted Zn-dependent peptidase
MRTSRLLPLALLLLAGPALGGDGLTVERFQLDNGLVVILHEDHRLPQVAVNVWYHVGSREEPPGRSGFAHLFEHLMFMGTERVPTGQFDLLMEAGGGSNNASTDFDRTNYYSWGPSSLLPTLLWLEADRMEALGRAMTQEKLDLQRDVVRNERRQWYDNAPYGPSELLLWEELFPHGHPYHFHIIGSHEDLLAATVEDVQAFFATFYVPNNASLVVAGDFDPAAVRPLVRDLFGSLPRGAPVPRRTAAPVVLEREKRVTVEDEVQLPRVTYVWPSPAYFGPGDAEMDLLGSILTDGRKGRLTERLVHVEQVATGVSAAQESLRLGSVFTITATAAPGVALEAIEAAIEEEVGRLRAEEVSAEEIDRARAGIETAVRSGLQSVREVADRLNMYDAYLGRPDGLAEDLGRYRTATPAGLKAVAARVLGPERVVMRVVPRGPLPSGPSARDARPPDAPTRPFAPPTPDVHALENGLSVWHLPRPGSGLVAARLVLPAGAAIDPPGKAGRAWFAGHMMEEGAGDLDAFQFAARMEALGASFAVSVGHDAVAVDLEVLASRFAEAFGLFASAVASPRDRPEDFARLKKRALDAFPPLLDEPAALGARVARQAFFGREHPYGRAVDGYPATVEALALEDVLAWRREAQRPGGAVLLVAGDVPREALLAAAKAGLGALRAEGPAAPRSADAVPVGRTLVVDRPGAAQTWVRQILPAPPFGAAPRVGLRLLNVLYGGTFMSRLNANLREDKGYTYGISSRFVLEEREGTFATTTLVETGVTGPALGEILAELGRLASGDVSEEEASKARATAAGETVEALETLAGTLGLHEDFARYGVGPGGLAAAFAEIPGGSAERLNALARGIDPSTATLVLVGDAKTVVPALKALGLDPAVVSREDALAGRLP